MILRIGTRDSALAVRQAELARDAILALRPDLTCQLVPMKTSGDHLLDTTLDAVGGKGLFVKELDIALQEGRIDIAVHSLKDVPMEVHAALPLVAVLPREDPRDAVVLTSHPNESDKPIGTSSQRRILQLQKIYPFATYAPVRGNLQTRLRKLENGDFLAVVLAAAGLHRLGLEHLISKYLDTRYMIPAAGQGVIAIQSRADFLPELWQELNDRDTWDCAMAERAFVRALEGGCSDPTAAYATLDGEMLHLVGMDRTGKTASADGPRTDPEQLGKKLAQLVKE